MYIGDVMIERRKHERINIGKINYEAVAAVIGSKPHTPWEALTLAQRIALSAAAMAVLAAAENNLRTNDRRWPQQGRPLD